MNCLEKYTDDELFHILDSNVEEEIRNRGYEYGWHKKIQYAGVIYIMVNPAFPGLVKIGYADDVEKRLKSLNRNSGLPDPFHVYAVYKVKKRLEDLKLHSLIDSLDSDLRHSRNKEFYEMTPEKAYGILAAIAEINGDEDLLVKDPLADEFFQVEKKQERTENIKPAGKKKRVSKPPLTFEMLGIPIESTLVYRSDPSITCKTYDDKSNIVYQGEIFTMSGFVKYLKGGSAWQGSDYLLYNGKRLTQLRKEMEEKEEKSHA